MDSHLSERKKKILHALVDSYITTAEPIASSSIQKNYLPDVSSATIRSDLATLEEMGFLVQPHVSAGRVPSSKAYKYYVEHLTLGEEMKNIDLKGLKAHFDRRIKEMEDVVKKTAKIISDETNYTSVILLKPASDVVIQEIKLIDLSDGTALVIIITDSGIIKDKLVDLPGGMMPNYVAAATKMLNRIFSEKKLEEIGPAAGAIDRNMQEFKQLFDEVYDMLQQFQKSRGEQIYLEGANKIFEYPEYDNIDNVKHFLSIIESKEKLHDLIEDDENIEFSIKIGKDDSDDLQNMALVTAKYFINGKEVGHAGVIGPERMDYRRVISVLHNIVGATKSMIEDKNEEE